MGFSSNDGGGVGGLVGRAGGRPRTGTSVIGGFNFEEELGASPDEWNRYTLIWNESGLPDGHILAIYVNGEKRSNAYNLEDSPFSGISADAFFRLGYMTGGFVDDAWTLVDPGAAIALDEFKVYNTSENPFDPVDTCTLDVELNYTDNSLDLNFEVGTMNSARWKVFLVRYGVTEVLVADRVIVDPPIDVSISIPEFQSRGTIGFLTTLATKEDVIVCSDFETVDTGQSEDASVLEYTRSTAEELKWIFEQKFNEILFQHPENVQYGIE
jgi:hypothetical protein